MISSTSFNDRTYISAIHIKEAVSPLSIASTSLSHTTEIEFGVLWDSVTVFHLLVTPNL